MCLRSCGHHSISITAMMGLSWVFEVILYLFIGCNGFLLDDRNKPSTTSVSFLTDQHYNALFNLIVTERQSRSKLEQQLVRLEQELLATQQGVTDIYHTSANNNATLELEAKNWNTIRTENNDLKNRYNLLEYKFNSLSRNHSNLENYTKALEQEVTSLQQLKGVTDLQTVLSVRNETKILREELKNTNNSLNSVRNEAEARKQDFVALLKKADSTEHKLKSSVTDYEHKQNQTQLEIKWIQNKMQKNEMSQNQSVENLDLEIHNMSNRAAFTVCATQSKYSAGDIVLFPVVQTIYGVSNLALSVLGTSGKFKCEKAGLYLISAFLMTNTKGYVEFRLYKNSNYVAPILMSVNVYQTSTIAILQHLEINDSIYIKNDGASAAVWGTPYSCLSFLQLTN